MNNVVRVRVTQAASEAEAEKAFFDIFHLMCEKEIPIVGFIIENQIGYMVGEPTIFKNVFANSNIVLEKFDFEQYIKTAGKNTSFWIAQLNLENPMKSTLIKYK